MTDKTTWGSHVPVHKALFKTYEVTGVLELGAGYYSTKMFFDSCNKVTSIETDGEWVNKLQQTIKQDDRHQLVLHEDASHIGRSVRRAKIDTDTLKSVVTFWKKYIDKDMNYLFIDCISSLRLEAVEKLRNKFDIIVMHDVNPKGLGNHYTEDMLTKLAKSKKYNLIVDSTYTQHTGILISKKLGKIEEFITEHSKQTNAYSKSEAKIKQW